MVLGLSRVYHFVFSLVTSMSSKIPIVKVGAFLKRVGALFNDKPGE